MSAEQLHYKKIPGVYDLTHIQDKNQQRYPFLLESTAHGSAHSRFDILFAFPQSVIKLDKTGLVFEDGQKINNNEFLTALNRQYCREKKDLKNKKTEHLPFIGGWFFYLSYELAQEIEPSLKLSSSNNMPLPQATAVRVPAAIIVDKKLKETWLIAELEFESVLSQLNDDINHYQESDVKQIVKTTHINEEIESRYYDSLKKIHQYIVDGDVFQVNLSRLWQVQVEENQSAFDIYRRLREKNPAPFSGLCFIENVAIISSSPERLFKVDKGRVETRPIAGTRPRGRSKSGSVNQNADLQRKQELISHPKERAEHVMLIDLERNDLGRIAQPGSVTVDEFMVLETYEHVHHIVSNVSGTKRDDVLPGDIIAAVFPGGTITGCPKVRCMEIIAELEKSPREAYTGAIGYLNRDGSMDSNILIRTMIMHEQELHIRAGAGIVIDSDPIRELEETRVKAKGMLAVFE